MEWEDLCGRLERRFLRVAEDGPCLDPWGEDDFNALAIEAFAWQFELCCALPGSVRATTCSSSLGQELA